jgi:hypothetical protein
MAAKIDEIKVNSEMEIQVEALSSRRKMSTEIKHK